MSPAGRTFKRETPPPRRGRSEDHREAPRGSAWSVGAMARHGGHRTDRLLDRFAARVQPMGAEVVAPGHPQAARAHGGRSRRVKRTSQLAKCTFPEAALLAILPVWRCPDRTTFSTASPSGRISLRLPVRAGRACASPWYTGDVARACRARDSAKLSRWRAERSRRWHGATAPPHRRGADAAERQHRDPSAEQHEQ